MTTGSGPVVGHASGVRPLLRRHRVVAHHVLWGLCALGYVVAAAGWTDSSPDIDVGFAFGVVGVVLGAGALGIGLLAADGTTGDGRTRDRGRTRARGRSGHPRRRAEQEDRAERTLRPPWRPPHVVAYGLGVPAAVFLAGWATSGAADDAGTAVLLWALALAIAPLCGLAVGLLGVAMLMVVAGVIGFGRPLITGRVAGRRVPRAAYAGPFVGVVALLAVPLVLLGPVAYDSPYRRDVWPLLGVVREGVEVELPWLLLVSQVATWTCFGGLAAGFVLHRLLARGSRAGGSGAVGALD